MPTFADLATIAKPSYEEVFEAAQEAANNGERLDVAQVHAVLESMLFADSFQLQALETVLKQGCANLYRKGEVNLATDYIQVVHDVEKLRAALR